MAAQCETWRRAVLLPYPRVPIEMSSNEREASKMSDSGSDALGANALPTGEPERIRSLIESWTTALVTDRMSDWASHWWEDGLLLPPNHPRVVGRSNILHYATHIFYRCSGFRFSEWSFAGQGDLAVVTNQIELDTTGEDGPLAVVFNQIIVLRRDAEQAWRIKAVILTPIE